MNQFSLPQILNTFTPSFTITELISQAEELSTFSSKANFPDISLELQAYICNCLLDLHLGGKRLLKFSIFNNEFSVFSIPKTCSTHSFPILINVNSIFTSVQSKKKLESPLTLLFINNFNLVRNLVGSTSKICADIKIIQDEN